MRIKESKLRYLIRNQLLRENSGMINENIFTANLPRGVKAVQSTGKGEGLAIASGTDRVTGKPWNVSDFALVMYPGPYGGFMQEINKGTFFGMPLKPSQDFADMKVKVDKNYGREDLSKDINKALKALKNAKWGKGWDYNKALKMAKKGKYSFYWIPQTYLREKEIPLWVQQTTAGLGTIAKMMGPLSIIFPPVTLTAAAISAAQLAAEWGSGEAKDEEMPFKLAMLALDMAGVDALKIGGEISQGVRASRSAAGLRAMAQALDTVQDGMQAFESAMENKTIAKTYDKAAEKVNKELEKAGKNIKITAGDIKKALVKTKSEVKKTRAKLAKKRSNLKKA